MKKICLIAALFIQVQFVFAQEALLWKVTGKGTHTSYLFATGIVCKKEIKVGAAVEQALASSKKVYFEMPDKIDEAHFDSLTRLPKGDSISHYFSAEEYSLLKSFTQRRLHFNIDPLGDAIPGFLYTMLRNLLSYCDPNVNYTSVIQNLAKDNDLEVFALETIDASIAAQNNIPGKTYSRLMMDYVYETARMQELRKQLMALYEKRDIAGMYALHKSSKELGGYEEKLLGDRNKNWIPVIKKAFTTGPTFVCAGALQFWGDEGLITLLRKEGYTVTAVQ
ncbi:TraB/GumN family protein [uncultured Chitinophaga sp.]|uniref:TraB/GumN family protein n=1 Tax=uncultured Chitinophaga sp. TaxID=339340 RepID=UPI0025D320A0|nr:TraB/GumN family protein [uncultured Chitinophaga sp.]